MVRIDEIYNNTFWPWLKHNRPGMRMFMCDPFGRSDPDSVVNFGSEDVHEHNYIFFFDQEPIHLSIHTATFDEVLCRNNDIKQAQGAICTSERNSDNVDALCAKYGWKSYYYFFHGWAALDWYRGYDKTFLIKPIAERAPTKTFLAPNRIIAGERRHRLEMLYHIFKNQLTNNLISCPDICPAENISVVDAVEPLLRWYPDIQSVFSQQTLPMQFGDETTVEAAQSSTLDLFDESSQCLLYLVTETIATGARQHLTEKVFKPICLQMPFILVGTYGSLAYLRSYGFQTFGDFWNESYDDEPDDQKRIELIGQLLKHLDSLTPDDKTTLFHSMLPVINHNYNHFYSGSFESVLWKEMQEMLNDLQTKLSI